MNISHLREPLLEFGRDTHIDVRFGIAQYFPFDKDQDTAPSAIRIGLIGTSESIEALSHWLETAANGVAGKTSPRVNFHPAFPGFTEDSCFGARLVTDARWTGALSQNDIDTLLAEPPTSIVSSAVDSFVDIIRRQLGNNSLDVVICAPPADLLEALDAAVARKATVSGDSIDDSADEEDGAKGPLPPPFHDLLKARGMSLGVPLQMVRPPTYGARSKKGSDTPARASLQDEATRVWNFFTALYYKAGGIPWRLVRDPSSFASCFAGISFFKSLDGERMLTSVAQVFNERGEGIIVRGAEAQKTAVDRQPHLNEQDAYSLIKTAIDTYRTEHRHTPARLVVHKTSNYALGEMEGITKAAREHDIELVDLITLVPSNTRLFRMGINPPLRGTLLNLSTDRSILYLRGSVGFFEMYPGMYVPRALEIRIARAESTMLQIASEILALSKLNWNNTQFDGGEPITVRAARQVGDILKCLPKESDTFQRGFRFYM